MRFGYWMSGLALIVAAGPLLWSCAPSGGTSAPAPQTAVRPAPLVCSPYTPEGGHCVTILQHEMRPAATDQGYATQMAWTMTNRCPSPMRVTWGWAPGQVVGETVLAEGQSVDAGCLLNIDGCGGRLDTSFRCLESLQ